MAQVIGSLRPDKSTHGEELVLKKLRTSLPKEFYIYVECPLRGRSHRRGRREIERYPDFIVLADFGVVVLEVKDWVQVLDASKSHARIRMQSGEVREFGSPVKAARDYALMLSETMQGIPELLGDTRKLKVPWGYAAVLPHVPMSVITHLRQVWGDAFVLGKADLEEHVATQRIQATVPWDYMLKDWELETVRGVINPSIVIEPTQPMGRSILLDQTQERIVAEAATTVGEATSVEAENAAVQADMFLWDTATEVADRRPDELLPFEEQIVFNASVRLVRGVAGSGKSLVLVRRAEYLKAQYPEWKIAAITFNRRLAQAIQAQLKGTGIDSSTFHSLCRRLLKRSTGWKDPVEDVAGWIETTQSHQPVVRELGSEFLSEEIQWIKDVGLGTVDRYLEVERKGRGIGLTTEKRRQILEIYHDYQGWLKSTNSNDWADVPSMVLREMEAGAVPTGQYDVILIDEAQDFAPTWIAVIKRLLKSGGLVFLADDPAQSIYRYFSWKEKGISVVGRTRWLRVPYRNTREIHTAAFAVIKDDPVLISRLEDRTGMLLKPDLVTECLRSGPKPELRQFSSPKVEAEFTREEIRRLFLEGYRADQIAVLCRRRSGVKSLTVALQGLGINVDTFHAFKGIEFDVVFLSQMDECMLDRNGQSDEQVSEERRLVYMAMTRARDRLYLSTCGPWPQLLEPAMEHGALSLAA